MSSKHCPLHRLAVRINTDVWPRGHLWACGFIQTNHSWNHARRLLRLEFVWLATFWLVLNIGRRPITIRHSIIRWRLLLVTCIYCLRPPLYGKSVICHQIKSNVFLKKQPSQWPLLKIKNVLHNRCMPLWCMNKNTFKIPLWLAGCKHIEVKGCIKS